MRRLPPAILATAIAAGILLATPSVANAQPDPCQAGFTLLPSSVLCTPQPSPAAAQPAPQPTPQRSLLDRVLGRNKPAPASPAPTTPAPAAPAPVAPPPTTAPPAAPPALIPLVILPPPGTPLPTPSERTVWLHTCVDLYVANNHLVQIDNQQLDVPDLAYVLFQCSATPGVIPVVPGVVVPGQPPSAGSETVSTHLPVTG